ncbi:hypothetical protein [Aquipuribacter sp. MA13-6]|uniref:hypothetical protein n=1 Tax=unclassified Aquipuribacter TaxID=2635084 RepID=UPI003EEDF8DB
MTRGTSAPADPPDVPGPAGAGRRDHDGEDRRLLRLARSGDGDSVASLYDRHASALYALSRGVLGDGAAAEEAVVDVVVDACGPGPAGRSGPRSVRHELAVATYRRCAAPRPLAAAARSRAVLALCLHGEHTYREAVALTGVEGASLGRLLQAEMHQRGLPLSA